MKGGYGGRSATTGALCVLAASVLWGTTGTAATFAPAVGPLAIGAVAMGLGGLLQALAATAPISRSTSRLRARRGTVLLGAVSVAVYPLAFYSSMRLAGVAVGTVVSIGTAPLASAVIERVVDRRRLTRRWMVAASLGLLGTVLLCVAEATRSSGGTRGSSLGGTLLGIALGLVAAGTYALYSWAAHRLITRDIPSRAAMGAVFGLGGVLLVPVLLVTGGPLVDSWTNAAVGTYMALVPMFAGYLLFGWGLAHVPASTATTLSLLEPAVAAVLAVLVVGERLPAAGWAGVALVVLCLAVLTLPTDAGGRPSRRGPRRAAGETLPGAAVRDDREHPAGVAGARPGSGEG
ncbi:DMT family transporter [Streptomyces sp. NPDC015684]|uniref:DMT family transporter n=1 Tax=unclassified Streptomyces TaxID=2593676 RepID=UPI0036FEB89E